MKTFIIQNWFKLGVLTVILIVGIFYITNYKKISDIEIVILKEKCIKDADNYISKISSIRNTEDPTYPMTSYSSVYNPELKTCLVNFTQFTSPGNRNYAIIDIYLDKEIASYSFSQTDEESLKSESFKDNFNKYNIVKNKYFPE